MQTAMKLKLNAGKTKQDIFQQIPQQKYARETHNLLNPFYLKLFLHFISYSRFLTFPIFKIVIENKLLNSNLLTHISSPMTDEF
jgi:hypothetical protein